MIDEELSEEVKADIIDQLESVLDYEPYFYLKFCKEERFANDICNGNLFANTPEFFRELEMKNNERGQGDKNEGIISCKLTSISATDKKTLKEYKFGPLQERVSLDIKNKDDDKRPIISFVGIPLHEMSLKRIDLHHVEFEFPFAEDEYKHMSYFFGEYCVVVGGMALRQQIKEGFSEKCNIKYKFKQVEYNDPNSVERLKAARKNKSMLFCKDTDLSYQREYRLVIYDELPADHYFRIGRLHNAEILPSSSLRNLGFSLEYSCKVKGK